MGKSTNLKRTKRTLIKIEKVFVNLDSGTSLIRACENVDLVRSVFYEWMNEDPANKNRYYQLIDDRSNLVEDALYKDAMTNGNTVAKIFWLKNRRSDRWSDRIVNEHKGAVINIHRDLKDITEEEAIQAYLDNMNRPIDKP